MTEGIAVPSRLKEPTLGFLTICRDMGENLTPGLDALRDNIDFLRLVLGDKPGALEVAIFPRMMEGETTPRDFYGETLDVNWFLANKKEAVDGVKRLEGQTGVLVEALCYCANPIGNPADMQQVKKGIEVASAIGAPYVVTFIGNLNGEIAKIEKARGKPMGGEQRRDYFGAQLRSLYRPVAKEAVDKGVQLAIEPCSMRGAMGHNEQSLTTNWFSNPAEWRFVLDAVPELGMWYDASHGRNYRPQNDGDHSAAKTISAAISEFGKYFRGCHLKDGEDDIEGMANHYAMGNPFGDNSHTGGLWNARAPGRGQINWLQFEKDVRQYAPKAFFRSIEMEDLDVSGRQANEEAVKATVRFYVDNVFTKLAA